MPFSYANPASGPSAGGIGWFDFGALNLTPGQSQLGLTGTLNDGTVVTFDVAVSNISGTSRTFSSGTVPTWGGAFFGNTNYTGVAGNVALNSSLTFAVSNNSVTISNITVKDALNNAVPNYTVLIGDAESSGVAESWTFNTNGTPWSLFTTIGTSSNPTLVGLGTPTATITGNDPTANQNEYILATNNPKTLVLSTATSTANGGQQAIVVGFAVTKVSIKKDVVGRLDPTDQFQLDITGNFPATATTTGNANGIQTATAVSYGLPTTPYTINESMAAGSANGLLAYTQTVTAVNQTPGQTIPVGGALPLTVTPILGDLITYTITNSIVAPTITKSVDKAFANIGDVITYSLAIPNGNGGVLSNVKIQDAIPNGTTFVAGSLTATNGTVVGTDPSLGVIVNGIPANTQATVSWKVLVTAMPVPNPIPNTATMIEPTGTTVISNQVTTLVNHAAIVTTKTVDVAFAETDQILTYTITLQNTGNVAANNVVITDNIPANTTFVAGSVTGATGTPPTLNVASIPAGDVVVVTFKVKVSSTIPTTNPIINIANTAFTYTVDPAIPNGASGTSPSNPAATQVNDANITTSKTVDKDFANVGDTITYTITVTNSGNVAANNAVLLDALPVGTTFVPGSLTGATGTPPTLVLNAPVPAGGSVIVTYKVLVGAMVPNPNPVENSAQAAFTYTVDPAQPNDAKGTSYSNIVGTEVNTAKLVLVKQVDKQIAYLGDVLTYQIAVTNTGNTPANNVVITDLLATGFTYVPGSLAVSVPATGDPTTAIALTNPLLPGETVAISFQATVTTIPIPNPAPNTANAAYTYTVDPQNPNAMAGATASNTVHTIVFRNNFGQQISDLIASIALEQAALAAIANAEGAKIQRMAAMPGVTPAQLLCLNKSVSDMLDSITLLEAVLKQKLGIVSCQIDGGTVC